MKKQDDGYVLVLVLVVMVVLGIVSAGLMTLGLSNLKSQRASVQRMEDKYAAMGQIEKAEAALRQKTVIKRDTATEPTVQIEAWLKAIPEVAAANAVMDVTVTEESSAADAIRKGSYEGTVTLDITEGTSRIQCRLTFSGAFEEIPPEDFTDEAAYEIRPEKVEYTDYDISVTAEEGGEAP